jgi:hypothetical protein
MKTLLIAVLKILATSFKVILTVSARDQIKKLRAKNPKAHKMVSKALKMMSMNLRHPGLATHKWNADKGPGEEQLFESYATQGGTAFRIFWFYDTEKKGQIIIVSASKHP